MAAVPSNSSTALAHLARSLAGEFDNKPQSLADPAWFLHLRVWNRPLPPHLFAEGYGFFIEQINVATGKSPYRQRVLHIFAQGERLKGQYYALRDPQAWAGSALAPEQLRQLQQQDLMDLPTCALNITFDPVSSLFRGRLPDETLCSITINGQTSYIYLAFDIGGPSSPPAESLVPSPVQLTVYDHGVDSATGATTWGPKMGPFQLLKTQDFSISSV
jgi:hypothetical protein